MREYEQRQHPLRLLSWRVLTLALFFLLVVLGNATWGVFQKERDTREKREHAENELKEMELREHQLRQEVSYLNTNRGMEEELRKQFEVGKPGEHLIVVVEKEAEQDSSQNQNSSWWHIFFPLLKK